MTPIEIREATVDALQPLVAKGVRVFDSRMFSADVERDVATTGPIVSVYWLGASEELDRGSRYSTRTERITIAAVTAGQSSDTDCADAIAELEADIRDCLFASTWLHNWTDVSDVQSEISMEAGGSRVASLMLRISVKQTSIRYVPTAPVQTGHKHRITTDPLPAGTPETVASVTMLAGD